MIDKDFKQLVYKKLKQEIEDKINTLQSEFKVYSESAANETKSTAGDKHDTSKSMMQLEQEKLSGQLSILRNQRKSVELLPMAKTHTNVEFGSMVETNQGIFYFSISLSRPIELDGKTIQCISAASPIGKLMIGKSKEDEIRLMDKTYKIMDVL